MKRFQWEKDHESSTRHYSRWVSDDVPIQLYGFSDSSNTVVGGTYSSGVNGRNTVYAAFIFKNLFFTNMTFGWSLYKHFQGRNAWKKARAWLDYLLNNTPNYVSEWKNDH